MTENTPEQKDAEFEKNRLLSRAVTTYVYAENALADASRAYNEACVNMRKNLDINSRFIVKVNHQFYLVTSDDRGNFSVEKIDELY